MKWERLIMKRDQNYYFKLGISPINWVNEDIPELGDHYTFEDLITDMSNLGFIGTEMSRKFPKNVKILRNALAQKGIQLTSQWKSVLFSDPEYRENELHAYREHVRFLKQMGCKHVVTCEIRGSIHWDPRRAPNEKEVVRFTDDEWENMVEGLHQAGEICREYDMELVYHHHVGTVVERPEEIDRLMETTDPELVSLLFDTGHAFYGGSDPLTVLKKYYDRIKYIHLKDVRQEVIERVRKENIDFITSIVQGVFTVPGDGRIDFTPIFKELIERNYRGWAIIEAEQDPSVANPYEYAKKTMEYIEHTINNI